ncbi:MAG: amidophosphoribosyltransferase [Alphaproteobacteria bacterium RIFCSPHIGHO2_12_FULL_45_9]|nr:MAG: amidophosphoribosyltransferase [Alphaproteobacteria bacterium RIFCSPHIGHO2_02_FULL_46_13]OFW98675.1 MAG: amidophosphoribosyltransferase [Alphaproteobacteria bacterium RIFCSPHIGHO2_12_FULL_45_9]
MNEITQNPFTYEDDKFHDECGVFGVFNHEEAATLVALGLHALQHRGQEATGIVSVDGKQYFAHRGLGLVDDIFNDAATIANLKGNAAVGHNRYATTGGAGLRNVQPLYADLSFGGFTVAHNGDLTNASKLRKELTAQGSIFQSTGDTETIIHLVALSRKANVFDRVVDALKQIEGAYSLIIHAEGKMMGVRDPNGFRPLVLGRLDSAYILASETCALDIIGAEFVRDIEPGELVVITEQGIQSHRPLVAANHSFCIFEYIYFARPDSIIEGKSVYDKRKNIGVVLAEEAPCDVDLVVPVPDSGVPAAIGYAQATGIPFELGIIRNHYVGRTFIEPTQKIRNLGVKRKHNANRGLVDGKRIVLVDDSIVRGTTSKKIVEMMRAAGAKEVHMRIACPPTKHSCYYGIDTPTSAELLASNHTIEEMAKFIGVDSLSFISEDGLYRAMGEEGRNAKTPQYCDACFTGDYPVALTDQAMKKAS